MLSAIHSIYLRLQLYLLGVWALGMFSYLGEKWHMRLRSNLKYGYELHLVGVQMCRYGVLRVDFHYYPMFEQQRKSRRETVIMRVRKKKMGENEKEREGGRDSNTKR